LEQEWNMKNTKLIFESKRATDENGQPFLHVIEPKDDIELEKYLSLGYLMLHGSASTIASGMYFLQRPNV
jgi:hypothetical protein